MKGSIEYLGLLKVLEELRNCGTSEKAPRVKTLAAKPDDLMT